MAKKKILHVVGDSKFGGGSVVIAQLVIDQSASGFDVAVLTTDSEFSAYLAANNIDVVNLDCIWRSYNFFSDIFGILKLARYLRANNFDVVHTHTTKAGFVGRVAAWMAKTKYIVHTVHGFPFSEVSSKVKVAVFSKLEAFLYKISTKVVFVSHYHLAWAVKLGIVDTDHSGAVAIRNGVKSVCASLQAEREVSRARIVFIGRIVKEKGVFDLLAAYRILHENYPDLKVVFIGDGPDITELRSLVTANDAVEFTGFVTEVPSLVSPYDIFVLPSYREGLSISAIEAQSMGLASVLSDVGGNVEVASNGNAALIFKTGDSIDLAAKLSTLLDDATLRTNLGAAALNHFERNFTDKRMLQEYKDLYGQFS